MDALTTLSPLGIPGGISAQPFPPFTTASPAFTRLDGLLPTLGIPTIPALDPTGLALGTAPGSDLVLSQLVQLLSGLMTPGGLTDPSLLGGLDGLGGGMSGIDGGALGGGSSGGGGGGGGGGSVGGYSGGGGSYSGGGGAGPVTSTGTSGSSGSTVSTSGGSSPGTAADVPAESQLPGDAKEAKEYLQTVPSNGLPASEFTGLQDGFSKQAAGFFKDLQKLGIKPTVTAGYETSGHSPGSDHYQGKAIDFVTPGGAGDAAKVAALADKYGIDYLDEYTNPSAYSTGGHFHISGDGTVPPGLQAANNKEPAKKSGGSKGSETGDKAKAPATTEKTPATTEKAPAPAPKTEKSPPAKASTPAPKPAPAPKSEPKAA